MAVCTVYSLLLVDEYVLASQPHELIQLLNNLGLLIDLLLSLKLLQAFLYIARLFRHHGRSTEDMGMLLGAG